MAKPEVIEPIGGNSGELTWLEALTLRHRLGVNVLFHTLLFSLALLLAYLVRYDAGWYEKGRTWFMRSFLPMLPVFILVKLIIFGQLKLFRGGWQYASIRDVSRILLASWLSALVMFTMILLFHYVPRWFGRMVPYLGPYFRTYPKGVLLLDFLATVFLISTARLAFRLYREELRPVAAEGIRRVLVVGAGNAAETIIREIHRMRVERYRVIGLVDDDPAKKGIFIHG